VRITLLWCVFKNGKQITLGRKFVQKPHDFAIFDGFSGRTTLDIALQKTFGILLVVSAKIFIRINLPSLKPRGSNIEAQWMSYSF